MTSEPTTTPDVSEAIGKLCMGGDTAWAHDDLAGLQQVARQLADYVPEPLHCELEALATACASDPVRAGVLWNALKNRLYREVRV